MESNAVAATEPVASPAVRELLQRAADEQETKPASARQHALQARVVARADGDRVGEAESLYRLASLAHFSGDPEDAFALAIEASEVAASCGARLVEAWAIHLLGIVHYQASNFSEALEHCLRALDLYQATDHGVDAGNILNTVAAVYHSMGDNDRAIVTYEQALAAAEPYGRPEMVALILGNIARIRSSRSEYLPAVSMGRQAVDIARQHSPSIVTNLLADLAEAYMGLADHQKAAECFAEARRVLAQMSENGSEPSYSAQLGVMVAEGRVALRRGALDEAIAVLQAALDMSERTDAKEYELEINDLLATAFKRSGRFEEALERRETHDAMHRQMFTHAADLRLRTLQVAHETATARHQAEIFRLRNQELEVMVRGSGVVEDPTTTASHHLEAFEQLAVLTEFRDSETGEHTNRVGDLAAEIAHALGKPPEWCEQLRLAARLHDIGKVAVPDSVLRKTGPLTVEEYEMMKSHTSMGHRILAGNSAPMFQMAAELAQSHHEWWDGSGYPLGLSQASIALTGRIVGVADVYDALLSKRPYKRAWPLEEAARFVVSGRGGQFDPDIVDAFV
ncbi:MAG: tetratricopeptide repeat protein, partial [Ilumatobacter sp.]|uniref:HD domain-containing phosphohydrolase n=1 Tax=Ilumatobacter sp. TaxID=1967498 RepID=UPI002618AE6C